MGPGDAYLVILCVLLIGKCHGQTIRCVSVPSYNPLTYSVRGDINIGIIVLGRDYSATEWCSSSATSGALTQPSSAATWAVQQVSKDNNLLPNLTLGFFMTESCFNPQTALAAALNFVEPGVCNVSSAFPTYDVLGIVGITVSSAAMSYSSLLNVFDVPVVGAISTAEVLSDKSIYKNFVRVVPSDYYQAKAIISIILHYNWTYISTLNSEGDYGRNGIRAVHNLAEDNDICVAYSAEIRATAQTEDYEKIAKALIRKKSARVLVFFALSQDAVPVLKTLRRFGVGEHYIIIGSDALAAGFETDGIEDQVLGGLYIAPFSTVVGSYQQFLGDMTLKTDPDPWFRNLYALLAGCSWDPLKSQSQQCDPTKQFRDTAMYGETFVAPLSIDGVYALAHAIHDYIMVKCPRAFSDKALIKSCIKRDEILPYLYNVQFVGTMGDVIRFDENGDLEGKYQILQSVKPTSGGSLANKVVGEWDKLTESFTVTSDLEWSSGQLSDPLRSPVVAAMDDEMSDRVFTSSSAPESICSRPCSVGEFIIKLELVCCWECRKCRDNEIVIRNGSSCDECPLLAWPDQMEFLVCEPIDPSFLDWTEPQALACLILAALGLVFSWVTVVLFTKYRHQRLIKATSRELSMITLSGVVLSYIAAFVLLAKPTAVMCYTGRTCFNLSFAIAYAPLLAKVTRIHRIFAAAKHGTRAPSFVSTRSQVLLSVSLIFVQVMLSVVSLILYPPDVTLKMPLTTEPFVEMLCDLPIEAVMYSLAYNLLLMLICCLFAFKTRRLPDNFNESKFIFVCVCTTLFLWLAFIPSYFSAFYASQKIVLLVSVLLFNSAVLLMCLYMPRIYAVIYLDEEKQGVTSATTQVASTIS